MALTVSLFSCRKEEPEPSGNRDLDPVPCDTCETGCPIDTSLLFDKWWVHYENGTGIGAAFHFKTGYEVYVYDGDFNMTSSNQGVYVFESCDSLWWTEGSNTHYGTILGIDSTTVTLSYGFGAIPFEYCPDCQ